MAQTYPTPAPRPHILAEFDPELTRPRQLQPPAPAAVAASQQAERLTLTSRAKMLAREAQPILDELAAVRAQLAQLPTAA